MIFMGAGGRGEYHFLKVDKSLCQPKLKSITVLLYDFVFGFLCKISTFTFAIMWDFLRHTGISGLANFLYGII